MSEDLSYFPAAVIVHTPNGETPACNRHARAISRVFGAMGWQTWTTPLLGFAPCQNCINEHKNAGGKIT